MISLDELTVRIEKDDDFATMPHIAAKVMKMVEDPDVSVAELEKYISIDQVLTAEILKLANSPLYAPRMPITSLKHAINYLGLANIRSLTLMVAIRSLYSSAESKEVMAAFWKHSAASAVVSRNIVMGVGGVELNAEEMFTVGLLHDFGKVVLLKFYPDEYLKVVEEVKSGRRDFYSAEKELLGVHHAYVGALILSKWGFHVDVVNAVGSHHEEPDNPVSALMVLANVFCSTWDYSLVDPKYEVKFFDRALEILSIDEDKWREVTEGIKQQLEESSEILGV